MSMVQTSKLKANFLGGLETSTLLFRGAWTKAGDKEGARGGGLEQQCCHKKTHEGKFMCLLGACFIHPTRVAQKEKTKRESTWGSPCNPFSVNDKISTEPRIRHE